MEEAEKTAEEISKAYFKASLYLQEKADKVFDRYKKNHNLSLAEARRLLNMMKGKNIAELKKALKKGIPTEEKEALLAMLDSPAYAYRIRRFEQMQDEVEALMQNVYKNEQELSREHYIKLAEDSYNKGVYEIQSRADLAFEFSALDEKQIDKVLKSKWSGDNYSKIIWKNTQGIADRLKTDMLVGLMTGKTNREMAKEIQRDFAVGAYEARRLVRTESNYISNVMEMESYRECDIEEYRFLATLDLKTSEKCQKLDNRRFKVSEAEVGKNMPPMHPFCRSTTIADFGEEIMGKMERRARNPVTGKNEIVGDMSYKEWYERYVGKKDKKKVEKSDRSGIIKTEGVSKLEQAKKRDHKILITDIAIDKVPLAKIDTLTDEQNITIQQKHKELLRISKDENNSNEVASVFKLDFTEEAIQLGTQNNVPLSQNPIICSMLINAQQNSVFVAHNHPSTQKFSYTDFSVILINDSVFGISVITNTGEVHILYKTEKYTGKDAFELLTGIKQKYVGNNKLTETEDSLISKEFLKRCRECGLCYKKGGGTNGK